MGFFDKMFSGLSKTRKNMIELEELFQDYAPDSEDFYDDLEELLVLSDVGAETAESVIKGMRKLTWERRFRKGYEAREGLIELLSKILEVGSPELKLTTKPSVILMTGVNGVGKTTSIGKLAAKLKAEGKSLADRLEELQREFGCYAQRLLTYQYEGEDGLKQMNRIMENLRQPLNQVGQAELGKSERTDYLRGVNGLPSSNVVEFRLSGGRKIVVRPSGTEPKLKAYLFACGDNPAAAEKELDHLEGIVSRLCGK